MKFLVDGAGALIGQSSTVVASQTAVKPASSPSVADQQAAILAGADPTQLFESTGAGGAKDLPQAQVSCSTGTLEIEDPAWTDLNGTAYVSTLVDSERYFQTLTLPPTFFVQDSHRRVTATVIDKLPNTALKAMEDQLAELNLCETKSTYLARLSR
ncbi:hypothetical protein [Marinobacterium sp. xm-d-564]|uniref:hypothetical protein n=1 Tax=Marinobacterium sp. xm-d-564 TaxID=2497742 RepID=UPI001569EA63|nr:hypothetical protein [Marinobacterium sp. xm-d-564]